MDPWTSCRIDSTDTRRDFKLFDDSFVEHAKPDSGSSSRDKLPDSDLYISKLEDRLNKLHRPQSDGAGLVSDLSAAKDCALVRLVHSSTGIIQEEDLDLDAEVTTSYLYRRLAPQKVALTEGEKVILIAADQLAKTLQKDNDQLELHNDQLAEDIQNNKNGDKPEQS